MHPDAVFLSGATDVGLWITKQQRRIGAVIYAGRVRAFADVGRSLNPDRRIGGRIDRAARRSGRGQAGDPTAGRRTSRLRWISDATSDGDFRFQTPCILVPAQDVVLLALGLLGEEVEGLR
jgi:hypothetical protein